MAFSPQGSRSRSSPCRDILWIAHRGRLLSFVGRRPWKRPRPCGARQDNCRLIRSRLSSWRKLSTTTLSWHFPRRLMLGLSRRAWRKSCQSWLLNWLRWSECSSTSCTGFRRQTAISKALIASSAGHPPPIDQPTICRKNRSSVSPWPTHLDREPQGVAASARFHRCGSSSPIRFCG